MKTYYCPICKVNQLIEPEGGPGPAGSNARYDCPGCGSFRMDQETAVFAYGLLCEQVEELQDWIRRRNAEADVPLIKETLIAKI